MDYLALALGTADAESGATDRQYTMPVENLLSAKSLSSSLSAPILAAQVPCVESVLGVESPSIDADAVRRHLSSLYPAIRRGCRMGLHTHLDRVPAEIVKSIIASAASDQPATFTEETLRKAGEAATLAALITEYRERLRLLSEHGEDVFRFAAALELCLIYKEHKS